MSFVTYRQSFDVSLLHELGATFKAHNIPYQIDDHTMQFDVSYANNPLDKDFRLKILQKDFVQADELLADYYAPLVADAPADYYLFSFSKIELMDIFRKPDEWGDFDKQLARKILRDKGHSITEQTEDMLYAQRMISLSAPDRDDSFRIILGYIFAFVFPLIGMIFGGYLAMHKRVLPNGEQVHASNDADRKSGKIILLISFVMLIILFILRLNYLSSVSRRLMLIF
jgi:hypothetical protein